MPHRIFEDEEGKSCQVWEVHPERAERRVRDRRVATIPYAGPERRKAERRVRSELRTHLSADLVHGWLAFHSQSERRRYSPIPPRWDELPSSELAALWREAHVVNPLPSLPVPDIAPPANGLSHVFKD